ncbi:hypothetical protein RCH14_004728 [Massilia sp. MP_M2]|uniref:hypothetical protein n=1 Tax=Massilia sp. MP_M2 TaxID=3071713 RepID=UPI00319DFA96
MKNPNLNKLTSVFMAGVMLISGCAKNENVEKPVFDVVPPAIVPKPVKVPASESRLAYYQANLDEATARWNECERLGPQGMNKNEQRDCSIARVASQNGAK